MDKETYKVYLEERRALISAELEQSRSFDKYVLTLAAGTFGLSLIFIRQVVPQPEAGTVWLLIAAWSAFAFSILLTLTSFLFSQQAYRRQLEILELEYEEDEDKVGEAGESINSFASCTQYLNWSSMSFFIIGVVFLVIFGATNLLP